MNTQTEQPLEQPPLFEWQHFLKLAEGWAKATHDHQYIEALYRSVISRAYYAGYHTAETLAIDLGLAPTASASDHYRVRDYFQNRGRLARQLSLTLRELYRLRIDADYALDEQTLITLDAQKAALRAIELGQSILQLTAHLSKQQDSPGNKRPQS